MNLKLFTTIFFLVFSFTSILTAQNWERTDMGYATTEMFKTTDNYQFIFYNSKSFWNDNLGNYGKNHCQGLVKINAENLFDGGEVYCESIDQKNNKFIVLLSRDKGDFDSGIGFFKFVDGNGPWKKFIGKKCNYAIQYIDDGFIRIDKCLLN